MLTKIICASLNPKSITFKSSQFKVLTQDISYENINVKEKMVKSESHSDRIWIRSECISSWNTKYWMFRDWIYFQEELIIVWCLSRQKRHMTTIPLTFLTYSPTGSVVPTQNNRSSWEFRLFRLCSKVRVRTTE